MEVPSKQMLLSRAYTRKQLQEFAQKYSIKANTRNDQMIQDLVHYLEENNFFSQKQQDQSGSLKLLPAYLKQNLQDAHVQNFANNSIMQEIVTDQLQQLEIFVNQVFEQQKRKIRDSTNQKIRDFQRHAYAQLMQVPSRLRDLPINEVFSIHKDYQQ